MPDFHNPYHFVPVVAAAGPGTAPLADANSSFAGSLPAHVRRDRYAPETHSGRIVCRLTTKTPVVLGATQVRGDKEREEPAKVDPCAIDEQPILPGSSLRGMVSAVAEAVTNSALRVLDGRQIYSYRRRMEQGLSALGMIIAGEGTGDPQTPLRLRPLTLPHLQMTEGGEFDLRRFLPKHSFAEDDSFVGVFPGPNLKVYLGDWADIREGGWVFGLQNYEDSKRQLYGLKLKNPTLAAGAEAGNASWTALTMSPALRVNSSSGDGGNNILLGQKAVEGQPVPWQPELETLGYTRGLIRALGVTNERSDIPRNKKHEIFLPYPQEMEQWPTLPILPEALERFHDLADERTVDRPALPHHPHGTPRSIGKIEESAPENAFRLKAGDVVYFAPTRDGKAVAEIALSSIWRGRVEADADGRRVAAKAADFFAGVNPDLLPVGVETATGRCKKNLTMAELLFGFVEQRDKSAGAVSGSDPNARYPTRALSGRVQFGHAELGEPVDDWRYKGHGADPEGYYLLKVLSSPKPPSPAMYFKPAPHANGSDPGGYVPKAALQPGQRHHWPQGRKFYLHRRHPSDSDWRSLDANNQDTRALKARVQPLREKLEFWFHVDFENLTSAELGLLVYSLCPNPDFRHKLGMGKPLGLGTVEVEIAGIFRVDRNRRYRSQPHLLEGARYAVAKVAAAQTNWPKRYAHERAAAGDRVCETGEWHGFLDDERARLLSLPEMKSPGLMRVRAALELLGDPERVVKGVSYPQVEGVTGPATEREHFGWFAANDNPPTADPPQDAKFLQPLPVPAGGPGQPPGLAKLPHLPPPPHAH